jgi:serine-type D-Ala-D-Ala carboxypeptidase/endopeptidase (penicillin-binding protein 4)
MSLRLFFIMLIPAGLYGQFTQLVKEWERDRELRSASISFLIKDLSTAEVVASHNAQTALVPASTLKVVTTGAALGILGAGYKYQTHIGHTGTFDKLTGIIAGDLIISGSGDPSLQSEYFYHPKQPVTDKWAAMLVEKGVKGITGSVIADASYFERAVPGQWIWGDIGNYYGAAASGLSFADNKFEIFFNSGKAGSKAEISQLPQPFKTKEIEVTTEVVASGSGDEAYVFGDPFGWKKHVSGTIPPGRKNFSIEAALPDPALLCAETLLASMRNAGIKCPSDARSRFDRGDTIKPTALFTHYSPTLDQLVIQTNLRSNNLYAESMLLTLGKGSLDNGITAVRNYWKKKGLDVSGLFMSDGSGLARSNAVTTGFLVDVLSVMKQDSVLYRIFFNSMPMAGRQGSMSAIGKGTPIEGKLRAKTGYITRVRSYCGYIKSSTGRDLAFAIILNNYSCTPAQARLRLERFMVTLYNL